MNVNQSLKRLKFKNNSFCSQIGNKTECALLGFVMDLGVDYQKVKHFINWSRRHHQKDPKSPSTSSSPRSDLGKLLPIVESAQRNFPVQITRYIRAQLFWILIWNLCRWDAICRTQDSKKFTHSTRPESRWAPSYHWTPGDSGDTHTNVQKTCVKLFPLPGCTRKGRQRSWWRNAVSCCLRMAGLTASPPITRTGGDTLFMSATFSVTALFFL